MSRPRQDAAEMPLACRRDAVGLPPRWRWPAPHPSVRHLGSAGVTWPLGCTVRADTQCHANSPLTRHHTRRWDSEQGRFVAPSAVPHHPASPLGGGLSPPRAAPKADAAPTAAGLFRGLLCGFERKQLTAFTFEDWIAEPGDWFAGGITTCAGTRKLDVDQIAQMRRAMCAHCVNPLYTHAHVHIHVRTMHVSGEYGAASTRQRRHRPAPTEHHRHHHHQSPGCLVNAFFEQWLGATVIYTCTCVRLYTVYVSPCVLRYVESVLRLLLFTIKGCRELKG